MLALRSIICLCLLASVVHGKIYAVHGNEVTEGHCKKDKNGDGKLDAKVSREAWEGQCLVWKVMWEQMMLRVGVC